MSPRPYRLIRSPRARRLTLRIDPEHGLEAVVPERYSEARARRDVEAFIATRLRWIDRSLAEVTARRTALGTDGRLAISGLIPYAGRPHRIVVGTGGSITALNGEIQIPATIAGDPDAVRRRLLSWLRRRARAIRKLRMRPLIWGSPSLSFTSSRNSWRVMRKRRK